MNRDRMFAACFWGAAVLFSIAAFSVPFIGETGKHLGWFHDSFFIYTVIARNFTDGLFSTFDTVVETNGYHPLWQAVITVLAFIFNTENLSFFIAVKFICFAVTVVCLFFFIKTLKEEYGIKPVIAYCAGFFFVFIFVILAQSGTEAFLAVPMIYINGFLLPKVFRTYSFKDTFLYFLSISLLLLIRFDGIVFVVASLYMFGEFDRKHELIENRKLLKPEFWAGALAGLLPLVGYFAYNKMHFGMLLPVSYYIKLAQQGVSFNYYVFEQLFTKPVVSFLRNPIVLVVATIPAVLVFVFAFPAFRQPNKGTEDKRVFYSSVMLFAVLYYFSFAVFSGWKLSGWHLYPLVSAAPLCLAVVFKNFYEKHVKEEEKDKAENIVFFIVMLSFILLGAGHISRKTVYGVAPVQIARKITAFEKDKKIHFGTGFHTGITAYISKKPVSNTHGLQGNRETLEFFKKQYPLKENLEKYGIDYYIGLNITEKNNCYYVAEPDSYAVGKWALNVSEWMCDEPVSIIKESEKTVISIFDMRKDK